MPSLKARPTAGQRRRESIKKEAQARRRAHDGLLLGIINKKKKVPRKGTKRNPSGVSAPSTRASARGKGTKK